jgi:dipeptidyl aminopeptidase/acylaminoacyl peptidase
LFKRLVVASVMWAAGAWAGPVAAQDLAQAATQDGDYPTNEDLRHVRYLTDPRISPDGRRVLVEVADATADGGRSHLWLIDVAGNAARQITFSPEADKAGEHEARWLGEDTVLFLAKRADRTQLFHLPMRGGEAQAFDLKIKPPVDASKAADALPPRTRDEPAPKIEPVALEVADYDVAPDASRVAILAPDPETPGEKKQKEAKADATWVDHEVHGKRLYLLDPATSSLTPVAVPPDVSSVAWAHSAKRLIAVSTGQNHLSDLGPSASVWMIDVAEPDKPQQIKELPRTFTAGQWSGNDAQLYFVAQSAHDAPPGYADLYEMDLASRQVRNVSGHSGLDGAIAGAPIVVADELWLNVLIATRQTYARLQQSAFDVITSDVPVLSGMDCDRRGDACVWIGESTASPRAVYLGARPGGATVRLNTPSQLPKAWPAVEVQQVHWRNGGLALEGLLFLPRRAKAQKVPLIVDVHGGPTGAWTQRFDPLLPFLLGQGFAVFRPNPRGSTGYGVAFAAANRNDLGGGDYRDIMSGTDAVIARYPVDAGKLILMGYSYGGEMAGFVEGKTDRFKAIISGAPVIDQESEYGTEDESWYDRWFYGKPWEHAEAAWRQSPLSGVAHAKSRFLLIQGEVDATDPLGQSQEMYRALRQAGVHVELVQYPRDGHPQLSRAMHGMPTQEPWHGYDARRRIMTFVKDALAAP